MRSGLVIKFQLVIIVIFYFIMWLLFSELNHFKNEQYHIKLPNIPVKHFLLGNNHFNLFGIPTVQISVGLNNANNLVDISETKKPYPKRKSTTSSLNVKSLEEARVYENDTLEIKLRFTLKCLNRKYTPRTKRYGDYWAVQNYIRADRGNVSCSDSITYATHGDVEMLDMIPDVMRRWQAPMSVVVFSRPKEWMFALNTIMYLRSCVEESFLIEKFASFHMMFHNDELDNKWRIPAWVHFQNRKYDCRDGKPVLKKLSIIPSLNQTLYPVSLARRISRQASQTELVLTSDLDFLPSLHVVPMFLKLLGKFEEKIYSKSVKRGYVLLAFGVSNKTALRNRTKAPGTQKQLAHMLNKQLAFQLDESNCPECSDLSRWKRNTQDDEISVLRVVDGTSNDWRPIFIGTRDMQTYEDFLVWSGNLDKKIQTYVMCLLGYEFVILKNAFMVKRNTRNHDKETYVDGHRNKFDQSQGYQDYNFQENIKKKYGDKVHCQY